MRKRADVRDEKLIVPAFAVFFDRLNLSALPTPALTTTVVACVWLPAREHGRGTDSNDDRERSKRGHETTN